MKNTRLLLPLVDLTDDDLVRSLAGRPHILENALADLVIAHNSPSDFADSFDIAHAVETEIMDFDKRDSGEAGEDDMYGSAVDELYETGVIDIDAVALIVQDRLGIDIDIE